MYLYLGQETVVNTKDIIGIFDLDNTTVSPITREFLRSSEAKGKVIAVSNELPKSFVVCLQNNEVIVYLSQLNPVTLNKRAYYKT